MKPHPHELTAPRMAMRTALILFVFVVIFTAFLAGTYKLTRPTLLATAAAEKMKLIGEVLPAGSYDNDLLQSTRLLDPHPLLGNEGATMSYRATLRGQPHALVFEITARDGYAGNIRLVLAVDINGKLLAVRVVEHHETPGLGDYIDPRKDRNKTQPWITRFNGLSLAERSPRNWRVKKDGGEFDAYTGATVTARAVVKATGKALQYVESERDALFAPVKTEPPAGAQK